MLVNKLSLFITSWPLTTTLFYNLYLPMLRIIILCCFVVISSSKIVIIITLTRLSKTESIGIGLARGCKTNLDSNHDIKFLCSDILAFNMFRCYFEMSWDLFLLFLAPPPFFRVILIQNSQIHLYIHQSFW